MAGPLPDAAGHPGHRPSPGPNKNCWRELEHVSEVRVWMCGISSGLGSVHQVERECPHVLDNVI